MQADTQSLGSRVAWVVGALLLLAALVLVVVWLEQRRGLPPVAVDEARYTAADMHAAVEAAKAQAMRAQVPHKREAKSSVVSRSVPGDAGPMQMLQPSASLAGAATAAEATLAGQDGLAQLIRLGVLRRASPSDLQRWMERARLQRSGGLSADAGSRLQQMPGYVVTGSLRIPDGLHGAHAVVLLIDSSAPHPLGNPGHSVLLDMETGGCMGLTCRMLLD